MHEFLSTILKEGAGSSMKLIFKLITTGALLIALIWLFADPKFDSAFATTVALAAVIGLFVTDKKVKKMPNQSQVVANNSNGIQAGGDIHIGANSNITSKHDVR